jgi:hypothetical protein
MIPTLDPVIASLAKDSDMGCKPILESTADAHALRKVNCCFMVLVTLPA